MTSNPNGQPTVYVVDDDLAFRTALSLLLESDGLEVRDYGCANEFLDDLEPGRPGCLVLDVRMPGMSGLELQDILAEREIRLPIIFMTGHGDVAMSVRALQAGAADFVEKPFDDRHLLERVHKAVEDNVRAHEEQVEREEIVYRFARLTPREQEVMALVVNGKSNKEIAAALNVSHRTVEIHRPRVMAKMEAKSLTDLLAMAVTCGIYEWPSRRFNSSSRHAPE